MTGRAAARPDLGTLLDSALMVLLSAGAGAALMYMLDPDRGRRRRALVRDQVVHAVHRAGDAVDITSRDVTNRARGVVAELRSRLAPGEVGDAVLGERVRARIGAVVGRSGGIEAAVSDGRVTLTGPILRADVDRLLRRVRAIRGVREVDDRLQVHEEPGNVPALQGRLNPPRGGEILELMQTRWSPAARLGAGAAGGVLAAYGLRRGGPVGLALAAAGVVAFVRGASNTPLVDLPGVATARHAARPWGRGPTRGH
jgi:hypothetical protein